MSQAVRQGVTIGGIGTHYSRYAVGNILALVAGFVSFPVLSRHLSNYEFGVIGYFEALLPLLVALLKFGLGDALLRFYPHGEGEQGFRRFVASLVLVPLAASTGIWLVLMAALAIANGAGMVDHGGAALLALATLPLTIFASYVQWLMGAQERSGINALTGTSSRWLQTLLVVTLVLALAPTAASVYLGRLLASMVMACWLGWWLLGQARASLRDADLSLTRAALLYSLPLALNEVALLLFNFADRLILNGVLGDLTAVGIYSIGSSLAMYVSVLVSATLGQAYTPVLNRIYIQQGAGAVMAFKRRILVPMTYVVVLLVAGLLVCGHDFFMFIAGNGKQASAPVFTALSLTFAVSTLFTMAGYGAILVKRTGLVLAATLVGVVVKVVASFALIPGFGVMGAVYATMLSQVAFAIGLCVGCPRELRCLPPAWATLQALMLAAVAVLAVRLLMHFLNFDSSASRFLITAPTVCIVFVSLLFAVSGEFRAMIMQRIPWR